jgi:hypothetical protein
MPKWSVPMEAMVTSWVTVEAETADDAAEKAFAEGVHGLMHLDHTYPEVGEYDIPDWFYYESEPIKD